MSTCDIDGGEFFLSLTGYDEIAISKAFDADVQQLRTEPFRFLRALVFVHQRREGLKDREAYVAAQELPIGQLQDYFAEEPPAEMDPDTPDTPAGKEPSPAA